MQEWRRKTIRHADGAALDMVGKRKAYASTDSKLSADQILNWVAASCHAKSVKDINKCALAVLLVILPVEVV